MADLVGLGPDSLRIKRVRVLIEGAVLAVIALLVVVFVPRWTDWSIPWWLAAGVVVADLAFSWWWAGVVHGRWGWRLSPELLEVRRGVIRRHTSLVPRNRIQNVTTSVGPLQSRFGLLTLTVHTAGTRTPNVWIADMDAGHAEGIRRQLGLT